MLRNHGYDTVSQRSGDVTMNAQFPDNETIRTVLALAARAPSVHNSQPWRWRVGDRSLHLHLTRVASDCHRPRPTGSDLELRRGSASPASSRWPRWAGKRRSSGFPNPVDDRHVATIEVSHHRCSELDVTLAAAIPRRRTDRRLYSPWPVPRADIAMIGTRTGTGRSDAARG